MNQLWTRFVDVAVERTLLSLGWERRVPKAKPPPKPPPSVSESVYGLDVPTTPSWERDAPKLRARPLAQPVTRAPAWHDADPFSVGEHTGTV